MDDQASQSEQGTADAWQDRICELLGQILWEQRSANAKLIEIAHELRAIGNGLRDWREPPNIVMPIDGRAIDIRDECGRA